MNKEELWKESEEILLLLSQALDKMNECYPISKKHNCPEEATEVKKALRRSLINLGDSRHHLVHEE